LNYKKVKFWFISKENMLTLKLAGNVVKKQSKTFFFGPFNRPNFVNIQTKK